MAAEPRVTARDPVEVVGGKRWRRKRERETESKTARGVRVRRPNGSEGFLFQISPDPPPPRDFHSGCILHQNKSSPSKE